MEKIIEGNKLIAEFMDYKKSKQGEWSKPEDYKLVNEKTEMSFQWHRELLFNYSWDWLMPVVEKISHIPCIDNTDGQFDFYYPRTFGMLDENTGFPMFRFNCHQLFIAPTLIEAVWVAVVDFINWYNSQQK